MASVTAGTLSRACLVRSSVPDTRTTGRSNFLHFSARLIRFLCSLLRTKAANPRAQSRGSRGSFRPRPPSCQSAGCHGDCLSLNCRLLSSAPGGPAFRLKLCFHPGNSGIFWAPILRRRSRASWKVGAVRRRPTFSFFSFFFPELFS